MAAIAVAVVGLLVAPLAFGSNMGFQLERNLDLVPGGLSYYVMSFPFYRSQQDLWDTGGGAPGTDGMIMSDDVLTDWFTNGDGSCDGGWECDGSISLLRFVNDPAAGGDFNQWVGQTIAFNQFTSQLQMSGTAFDITNAADPGKGYLVQIPSGTSFPVVIVGSHNPSVTEHVMVFETGALNKHPFSLPYHTTFTDSEQLLDTIPDPDFKKGVSLLRFINDPADGQFNQWVGQTVAFNEFTQEKVISGTAFPLVPGDGYLFVLNAEPETPGGTVSTPLPHY
jgi:hypothetical protein